MKRIILSISLICISILYVNAQASKVMAAYNYMEEYKLSQNGNDLVEAKEAIDMAIKNENTAVQGKTWYYKGLVYHLLANDSLLSLTDPNYLNIAFESFQKALEIEDKKFRNEKEAINYIRSISADVFNRGVDFYQKNQFEEAYKDFNFMVDLNKVLEANNQELVVDNARCLSNAGAAAENAGMNEEAAVAYEALLEIDKAAQNYRFLAAVHKKLGNKEKAMAVLDEAALKHPDDADIIIDQLNIFIEDGKLNEAIDKIDQAIKLQPDNDMLYFVKGNAYDKNGDVELAIVEYEKAIEINPKNDKALYNAGAMYFLGANKYIKEMADLNYNETERYNELDELRKAAYLKAKPYFEKILEIMPDDEASQKALFKINSALEK